MAEAEVVHCENCGEEFEKGELNKEGLCSECFDALGNLEPADEQAIEELEEEAPVDPEEEL